MKTYPTANNEGWKRIQKTNPTVNMRIKRMLRIFAQAIPDIESWPQENEARLVTRDGFGQHRGFSFAKANEYDIATLHQCIAQGSTKAWAHTKWLEVDAVHLLVLQHTLLGNWLQAYQRLPHDGNMYDMGDSFEQGWVYWYIQCGAQDKVARQSRFLEIADFLEAIPTGRSSHSYVHNL